MRQTPQAANRAVVVVPGTLDVATLLDVAPTILHTLGIEIPASFEGRVLHEAFARREVPGVAVA